MQNLLVYNSTRYNCYNACNQALRDLANRLPINWYAHVFILFITLCTVLISFGFTFHPPPEAFSKEALKTLLKKKNRLYYNYKRHGYKDEDKLRLEAFRTECKEAV